MEKQSKPRKNSNVFFFQEEQGCVMCTSSQITIKYLNNMCKV